MSDSPLVRFAASKVLVEFLSFSTLYAIPISQAQVVAPAPVTVPETPSSTTATELRNLEISENNANTSNDGTGGSEPTASTKEAPNTAPPEGPKDEAVVYTFEFMLQYIIDTILLPFFSLPPEQASHILPSFITTFAIIVFAFT